LRGGKADYKEIMLFAPLAGPAAAGLQPRDDSVQMPGSTGQAVLS